MTHMSTLFAPGETGTRVTRNLVGRVFRWIIRRRLGGRSSLNVVLVCGLGMNEHRVITGDSFIFGDSMAGWVRRRTTEKPVVNHLFPVVRGRGEEEEENIGSATPVYLFLPPFTAYMCAHPFTSTKKKTAQPML
jgi:hypothetical protein